MLAGAPCDLFLSADPLHLDRLATGNRLRADSRKLVATNSLTVLGPVGNSAIKAPRDLLSADRIALADPASPLGKCSKTYLEQLGIYEALAPKTVLVDNSRAIMAAIRSGRADAGIAFASDAAKATDCQVLFQIDPTDASLAYFAGVCTGQREPDAQALLSFFATPAAERCFRRCGLTLPKPGSKKRILK